MKATLSFDFDLPQEQEDFDVQTKASSMNRALWAMSQEIRRKLKYEDLTDDERKCWTEFSEMFWTVVKEEEINLY